MGSWKNNISLDGWGADKSFCPYLGASNDPETHFAYPSTGNFCHRVQTPSKVELAYQETYCLSAKFTDCSVYKQVLNTLPAQARPENQRRSPIRWRFIWPVLLILIVVLGLVFIGLWYIGFFPAGVPNQAGVPVPAATLPTATISQPIASISSPSPTTTLVNLITQTTAPTDAFTPSPSITVQPSATNTLPPTPGPGLGTPFGTENLYLIHRVQEGQTFGSLALLYDTTTDVIRAANVLREGKSLWPGDYLIIPIGQKDPTQVIAFTWYYTERRISLDELAEQFSVTAEEIRRYNDLGTFDWIPVGRWLILPVAEQ